MTQNEPNELTVMNVMISCMMGYLGATATLQNAQAVCGTDMSAITHVYVSNHTRAELRRTSMSIFLDCLGDHETLDTANVQITRIRTVVWSTGTGTGRVHYKPSGYLERTGNNACGRKGQPMMTSCS